MARLEESGLANFIQQTKKPLIGICLGMQLMFEQSDEVRKTDGLGIFKGRIEKFKDVPRIPHMGWNDLQFTTGAQPVESYVYFVHSFYAVDVAPEQLVAYADYEGVKVPAVVSKENFTGMQFHPEKSGPVGMKLLQQWLEKAGAKAC
jgi:imidazole glycerol-phosphate synthase subunit HisH